MMAWSWSVKQTTSIYAQDVHETNIKSKLFSSIWGVAAALN